MEKFLESSKSAKEYFDTIEEKVDNLEEKTPLDERVIPFFNEEKRQHVYEELEGIKRKYFRGHNWTDFLDTLYDIGDNPDF